MKRQWNQEVRAIVSGRKKSRTPESSTLRVNDREEESDVEVLIARPPLEALDELIVHSVPKPREVEPNPWRQAQLSVNGA